MQFPVSNWPENQTWSEAESCSPLMHSTNTFTHQQRNNCITYKKELYHHLAHVYSPCPHSPMFWIAFIWRCCARVSQFDKALELVDTSHRISAPQLEEPVHSVICQRELRLCQMHWFKRQSSNRGSLTQNGWRRAIWQEVHQHRLKQLQHHPPLLLLLSWSASGRHVHSSGFVSKRLTSSGSWEFRS